MMATDNGTGVVGNTRSQQASASINRAGSKQDWTATISKIGIGFILLSVLIVLATSELSLFWKLVASFVTYKIGSKLGDVKNHIVWKWPAILKVTGSVMATAAILGSGIGLWTGSLVKSIDTSALCAASPQEKICVEKRAIEKAEAEKERAAAATRSAARAPQQNVHSGPVLLGPEAFESKQYGSFKPAIIAVDEHIGPLNQYDDSCFYVIKSGVGELEVFSRPDFTSTPKAAIMAKDGVTVVSWGHEGPAYQVFYQAVKKSVKVEIERRKGNDSCTS